jgi:hypothetical protein
MKKKNKKSNKKVKVRKFKKKNKPVVKCLNKLRKLIINLIPLNNNRLKIQLKRKPP